jgi:hypothetical protein
MGKDWSSVTILRNGRRKSERPSVIAAGILVNVWVMFIGSDILKRPTLHSCISLHLPILVTYVYEVHPEIVDMELMF